MDDLNPTLHHEGQPAPGGDAPDLVVHAIIPDQLAVEHAPVQPQGYVSTECFERWVPKDPILNAIQNFGRRPESFGLPATGYAEALAERRKAGTMPASFDLPASYRE